MGDALDWEIMDCAGCGERIGGREPAWFAHHDGGLSTGSLINLDPVARATVRNAWHARCFVLREPR